MGEIDIVILIASVVAGATPVVLAALGETITEKAGIINLSLDGTILLSAMTSFAIAYESGHLLFGFISGAVVGALVAVIVAVFSVYLGQSQVAVGFVLTLMTRDLAYFLGNSYSRIQGPQVLPMPIPLLKDIPYLGPMLFNHNIVVYSSLFLIAVTFWYMYYTPNGLILRSVGELPKSSFARGFNPQKLQILYAVCGGVLIGLAGASFSLFAKPGWGRPQGAEGTGWIALALVIFGGWNPIKAALGAYIFSFLQIIGIYFQGWFPTIPAQVFQVAPFPIMIFSLMIMHFAQKEKVLLWAEGKKTLQYLRRAFSGVPPTSLGKPFRLE